MRASKKIEAARTRARDWYWENKERKQKYDAAYRAQNLVNAREYLLEWKGINRERLNAAARRRAAVRMQDAGFRILRNLRNRVWSSVVNRRGGENNSKTKRLLGCDVQHLKAHLQKLFSSGMSWENYGEVWEIDHIRPCASFDLTDPEQQKQCFHYTNLQPLLVAENRSKGAKW